MASQLIGFVTIGGEECVEYAIMRNGKPFKTARIFVQPQILEDLKKVPKGSMVNFDHDPGFGGIKGFQVVKV